MIFDEKRKLYVVTSPPHPGPVIGPGFFLGTVALTLVLCALTIAYSGF